MRGYRGIKKQIFFSFLFFPLFVCFLDWMDGWMEDGLGRVKDNYANGMADCLHEEN